MWNKEVNKGVFYILQRQEKFMLLLNTWEMLSFIPCNDYELFIEQAWLKIKPSIKEWSVLTGLGNRTTREGFLFLKKHNIIYPDKTVNDLTMSLCKKSLMSGKSITKIISSFKEKKGEENGLQEKREEENLTNKGETK